MYHSQQVWNLHIKKDYALWQQWLEPSQSICVPALLPSAEDEVPLRLSRFSAYNDFYGIACRASKSRKFCLFCLVKLRHSASDPEDKVLPGEVLADEAWEDGSTHDSCLVVLER